MIESREDGGPEVPLEAGDAGPGHGGDDAEQIDLLILLLPSSAMKSDPSGPKASPADC
jgi:hypothetical protein